MAEVHEDDRKLFCGALPQEAKDTDIKEYFSTFGEIDSVNLKMDPVTGRSRYTKGGGDFILCFGSGSVTFFHHYDMLWIRLAKMNS